MGNKEKEKSLEKGLNKLLEETNTHGEIILSLQYIKEFEKKGYEVQKYLSVLENLKLERYINKEIKERLINKYISKN